MKFRIRIDGKDSVSEGIVEASSAEMRRRGTKDCAEYEMEALQERIGKFVGQFVENGEGGPDAVEVEFDTVAEGGCCKVVARVDKIEPY